MPKSMKKIAALSKKFLKLRIKKNDVVIVTTGKSRGHIGKILSVRMGRVVVEGANLIKKHVKPNPQLGKQGGIVEREASMDASNVQIYNPSTKKADKVGYKFVEKDGSLTKIRVFKSDSSPIDAK